MTSMMSPRTIPPRSTTQSSNKDGTVMGTPRTLPGRTSTIRASLSQSRNFSHPANPGMYQGRFAVHRTAIRPQLSCKKDGILLYADDIDISSRSLAVDRSSRSKRISSMRCSVVGLHYSTYTGI